jgi:hypothetical protein
MSLGCMVAAQLVRSKKKRERTAAAGRFYEFGLDELSKRSPSSVLTLACGRRHRVCRAQGERAVLGACGKQIRPGIEFNLEPKDVVLPDICHVLGLKLEPGVGAP